MRKLNNHDVFMAFRVMKKIGIKEELVELAKAIQNTVNVQDQTTIGAKLILSVLANAGDEEAEKAVFEFLAGPMEVSAEEWATMDLEKSREMIVEMIKMNDLEGWRAFFTSAVSLLRT